MQAIQQQERGSLYRRDILCLLTIFISSMDFLGIGGDFLAYSSYCNNAASHTSCSVLNFLFHILQLS